ncbi:trypsin-like serine peptidase [Acinetobacter venetianus]|uniref:trypsin-like serine peptidase n=1 Tax=Acinetobacter venetianus TaxID=52133 RepID=UPI00289B3BEF|nr:trypsin-like peptidase domain-containing protein [Acinetobacter venetianus]
MASYETWLVNHDENRTDDVLKTKLVLALPNINFDSLYSHQGELAADYSLREITSTGEINKQENLLGRDGKYFENKLTQTIFFRCTGKMVHSHGQASGFVIGPNLVMTAGHCVHPGNSQSRNYENIYFQPGYPNHGRWYRIVRVYAHRSWVINGAYSADIAICVTEDVMSNDLWFGVKTHLGDSPLAWAIYGYPAESPFDGSRQFGDSGPLTTKPWSSGNLRFNLSACDKIDLTPGCSGGPWIAGENHAVKGRIAKEGKIPGPGRCIYVNGLNSHTYDRYPGMMITPYFGEVVADFVADVIAAT